MNKDKVIKSFDQWLAFVVIIGALSQFPPCVLSDDTKKDVSLTSNISVVGMASVGYNGSWTEFCDKNETEKDLTDWEDYETYRLRVLICEKTAKNGIDATTRRLFAAYKYCVMVRPQIYYMFDQLVSKLSQDERGLKVRILARAHPGDNTSACYNETTTELDKHCIERQNPYFVLFTHVLSRTCAIKYLTTEEIISYMPILCAGKKISGTIDWPSLIASVNITIVGT